VSGHTHVNLKDVEDAAPRFGFSPGLEARFASGALELEQSGMGYERLAPGFRVPFGHRHHQQEELYVVVSGSARLKLDDEVLELRTLDAVRVPAGTMRCFEAGPEGAEILAFGAPRMESPVEDTEMVPGWWAD
jgi:mannose-6-phosphate isomerase-like protein (cupin superfamily)